MTDSKGDVRPKKRGPQPPSIGLTAYICPHCGTHTTQYWHQLFASRFDKGKAPFIVRPDIENFVRKELDIPESEKEPLIKHYLPYLRREVFLRASEDSPFNPPEACNIALSKCYECDDIAVWIHDRLVWPPQRMGPDPNKDLPDQIIVDFEEARSILILSPRGAAALLRLCVEKLCIHLNAEGKTLDQRIANLVSNGLDERIQKSLDAVRVIGNEAVHPGQLDLKDDHKTAETLFRLMNLIAEKMISEPAHVEEIYQSLPPEKREGIEQRDKKTQ